jgi:protein-tyrosine-phosphatase
MGSTRTVVFVCLHGSAKSLLAAQYFGRLAIQRRVDVAAVAAGVEPEPEIPPKVIAGFLEDGIDVRGRRPRAVTGEELAKACHVVSFGCDLGEMVPPGLSVERWDDVPPVSDGFPVARDVIVGRLPRLLAKLEGAQASPAG